MINYFLFAPHLFQLHICQSSLWIALYCPSAAQLLPRPPPPRSPALPTPPQDLRAPTLPALPSLPRSTAPLPQQAPRLLGEWPQPSQAPTRRLGQQACRAAHLRMDPNQPHRLQGGWQKTDPLPTSLKGPPRCQRGRLPLWESVCFLLCAGMISTNV